MEEALIAQMLANTGMAALVKRRIDWNLRPQGSSLPGISLQLISARPTYKYAGRIRLQGDLVQADCWGATYASAKAVARAVEAFCGSAVTSPLQGLFIEGARDGFDSEPPTIIHRVSIDLRVWHQA